jgi:hypothetical protein
MRDIRDIRIKCRDEYVKIGARTVCMGVMVCSVLQRSRMCIHLVKDAPLVLARIKECAMRVHQRELCEGKD